MARLVCLVLMIVFTLGCVAPVPTPTSTPRPQAQTSVGVPSVRQETQPIPTRVPTSTPPPAGGRAPTVLPTPTRSALTPTVRAIAPTPVSVAPTTALLPAIFGGPEEAYLISELGVNQRVIPGDERTFFVEIRAGQGEVKIRKASVDLGRLRGVVSYTIRRMSNREILGEDSILTIKENKTETLEVIVIVPAGAKVDVCSDIRFRSETEAKDLVQDPLIATNFCVQSIFSWSMILNGQEGNTLVFEASIKNNSPVPQRVKFALGKCNFTKTDPVKYYMGKTELLLADRTREIGAGDTLPLKIRITPRVGTVRDPPACNLDLSRK